MQRLWICLLAVQLLTTPSANAQAIMETGGTYSSVAGQAAGLSDIWKKHGQAVRHSYEAIGDAQPATLVQTKAIEQYMQLGCQFQAKKQWENAEKSFRYVLQVVARRDGPGSRQSLPALEHLVAISRAENKLDDAISFQKTVLAFAKQAARSPEDPAFLNAQNNLCQLLIEKQDYVNAASVLEETMAVYDLYPTLPREQRRTVCNRYANVLRKLHRDGDADALEATHYTDQNPVDDIQNALNGVNDAPKPASMQMHDEQDSQSALK